MRFERDNIIVEFPKIEKKKLYMLLVRRSTKNSKKRIELSEKKNILFVDWSIILD